MKQFKNKLLVPFLILAMTYFSSCHLKDEEKIKSAELQLTACLGGQPDFFYYADSNQNIFISTTLYNPTNDTIHFLTMTCNYADFYLTNKPDFKVKSVRACYLDGLSLTTLPPKKKTDRFILISRAPKNINTIDSTTKIGMYYTTFRNEQTFDSLVFNTNIDVAIRSYDSLLTGRQTGKIIWSNQLELNRLNRQIY